MSTEPSPSAELTSLRTEVGELRAELEQRLAVLEDALDGMAERIEALARDGARTTTEHLADVLAGQQRLQQRLDAVLDARNRHGDAQ